MQTTTHVFPSRIRHFSRTRKPDAPEHMPLVGKTHHSVIHPRNPNQLRHRIVSPLLPPRALQPRQVVRNSRQAHRLPLKVERAARDHARLLFAHARPVRAVRVELVVLLRERDLHGAHGRPVREHVARLGEHGDEVPPALDLGGRRVGRRGVELGREEAEGAAPGGECPDGAVGRESGAEEACAAEVAFLDRETIAEDRLSAPDTANARVELEAVRRLRRFSGLRETLALERKILRIERA